MKFGNVAFTCIRLVHGATTSVCLCVCERVSMHCRLHVACHQAVMHRKFSCQFNGQFFMQRCNKLSHRWITCTHPHTHTQVEEHSHTHMHIQMNIQTDTCIELQSDGNNDTDNESCSNMCPLWVATSLLLLLCGQQQWRNQPASTPRRGTPFKVAAAGNKRTSNWQKKYLGEGERSENITNLMHS